MADSTLKDVANQALISLIQSASDAMTFLKGEIPVAVRELLTYYTAYYWVLTVCPLIWLAAYGVFIRGYIKKQSRTHDAEDIAAIVGGVGSIFALAVFFIEGLVPLMKITLAPRIWLIEYAASLVK